MLYPLRISDQSLEHRRWRLDAPTHSRGSNLHRRLLARAVADDAARMAQVDIVSHADFGASRRADHRWSDDLFRDRDDRRLDEPRRFVGAARDTETAERGGLRRHHPGWTARPGDDREYRNRQYRPARWRTYRAGDLRHEPPARACDLGPLSPRH